MSQVTEPVRGRVALGTQIPLRNPRVRARPSRLSVRVEKCQGRAWGVRGGGKGLRNTLVAGKRAGPSSGNLTPSGSDRLQAQSLGGKWHLTCPARLWGGVFLLLGAGGWGLGTGETGASICKLSFSPCWQRQRGPRSLVWKVGQGADRFPGQQGPGALPALGVGRRGPGGRGSVRLVWGHRAHAKSALF